ncbi:MAG: DoxX family protein [Elusimicrobia bacterium]|nr:DoxX family protein [Elusimicrobiota bacterium]
MMDSDNILILVGRVFLAAVFLASAFGKITNFAGTTQYMAAHGVPLPVFLCGAAVAAEVLGGFCLVLGFQARWGAIALFIYMVPVTLVFHLAPEQRIQFLKNLAIMGGLLHLAGSGPGRISLDHRSDA